MTAGGGMIRTIPADLGEVLADLARISPQARHSPDPNTRTERDLLVCIARDTMRATYPELVEATGLSRQRLTQIVAAGKRDQ